jgi:hypothetical protein
MISRLNGCPQSSAGCLFLCLFLLGMYPPDASPQDITVFSNPIPAGFYPDPSICRMGDNHYLVTLTSAYFPGIPVFQSRDLVKESREASWDAGMLCMRHLSVRR